MNYFYYKTTTWDNSNPNVDQETKDFWTHLSKKKNWRITQLPNGYYQTEYKDIVDDVWHDVTRRETIESAESAIDGSIEHYTKRLEFLSGPKVVKTFK